MGSVSPVGVFDSGAGGVSFLIEAAALLPRENFIYYGDTQNAPYGTKSEAQIRELTLKSGDFLYSFGVKAIVMACNTATSTAVNEMRAKLNVPVVSMEPAVKPALSALETGRALVLATPATVAQPRYHGLLERLNVSDEVVSVGCAGLAELVDERRFGEATELLGALLRPYEGARFDAIVLGCTHYIFIKEQICGYARAHFTGKRLVFDGNAGTARQLNRVLEERGLLSDSPARGKIEFYSSEGRDSADRLKRFFETGANKLE